MRGAFEMSMSLRTCEPMETAQSLGDDTPAARITQAAVLNVEELLALAHR